MGNNDILLINDPLHASAFEEALIATGDHPSNCESVRTPSRRTLAHKRIWEIFLNLSLPDTEGIATFEKLTPASTRAKTTGARIK
jgi:hypothetical protein